MIGNSVVAPSMTLTTNSRDCLTLRWMIT